MKAESEETAPCTTSLQSLCIHVHVSRVFLYVVGVTYTGPLPRTKGGLLDVASGAMEAGFMELVYLYGAIGISSIALAQVDVLFLGDG